MHRVGFALATAALLTLPALGGLAAGSFDRKLATDRQVVHVLNRLTFGPRPGDVDRVRRLGVEEWIRVQLHPERIPENPALESRLQSFDTLQLATWQLQEKYQPVGRVVVPALAVRPMPAQFFTPDQLRILSTGTPDQRLAVIGSIPVEDFQSALTALPPQMLQGLPELQKQAASARADDLRRIEMQVRARAQPLSQLLSLDERRILQQGTAGERRAFLMSLDEDKRRQVLRALPPQAVADLPDLRREALAARQPQQFVTQELIDAKLLRAISSNRQLEEVLVDFWLNHFNVFVGKGAVRMLLTSYERDAIRPHVLGRFHDLLLATARHPAMLFYLDNWQSQVPREDLPARPLPATARRPGLNENYGRELLELHTLGVDGGYTQEDVIAVARAFTGWTIYDVNKYAEFQFNPAMHDRGAKVVLGHTIPPGGGEQDGLQVIDILARHPSTAAFISRRLAQRFVADAPPQSLVDRMAATFTRTEGDLRAVLETMFTSREFLSEGAWQAKLKSPLEFAVSAVRALDGEVADTMDLAQRIADLGQPLYGKAEPTGYPDAVEAWANTAGFLARFNLANALASGQIDGISVNASRLPSRPGAAAARLLGIAPAPAVLAVLERELAGQDVSAADVAALVIASPDFQRR